MGKRIQKIISIFIIIFLAFSAPIKILGKSFESLPDFKKPTVKILNQPIVTVTLAKPEQKISAASPAAVLSSQFCQPALLSNQAIVQTPAEINLFQPADCLSFSPTKQGLAAELAKIEVLDSPTLYSQVIVLDNSEQLSKENLLPPSGKIPAAWLVVYAFTGVLYLTRFLKKIKSLALVLKTQHIALVSIFEMQILRC